MRAAFILLRKIAVVAAAAACTIILRVRGAADAGVNAGTFHALCTALQLGDGQITVLPDIVAKPKPPTDIYNLNMTLADENWQKTLYKPGQANGDPTAAEQPPDLNDDWKTKWPTWTAAAVQAKTKGAATKIKKEHGLDAADGSQLQSISVEISQIADAAFDVYSAVANTNAPKSNEDVIKELRSALTGNDNTGSEPVAATKAFTAQQPRPTSKHMKPEHQQQRKQRSAPYFAFAWCQTHKATNRV
uniref:Variant surface glycoprotein 1928 n=1 Tax=Trypanosoma brucei TaxID=5691 RepID=M4SZN7_9TRYP|nr:variant surface glycoprotein 1928 [Trypanosoma brucei]